MNDQPLLLIVEDSLTQAMQLQYALEHHGYRADVVHNGRQALEYLSTKRPTIVISDIVMPQMDGYELCRRIKDSADLKDIPVILLTALSDPHDIIRGLESGANNFIVKPYDERFLISRIQYTLANLEIRKAGVSDLGIEIYFNGKRHYISSDRIQVVDLLLSAYESAVEANLELNRTRTNYLALLESSVDAIVVVGESGVVEFCNPAAERLLNQSRQQMMGVPFSYPLMIGDSRDMVFSRDGRQMTAEMRVVNTSWEGRPALLAVLRDVTQRVEAENALRLAGEELKHTAERANQLALAAETASRAKSDFLANVSHEVRTPLNAILGMTTMLLDGDLTAEQQDYVDTIHTSGDSLLGIINNILDFSKVEAGELEVRIEPFDLRSCLEKAIMSVALRANEKGLDVVYLMSADVPETVIGDGTRVHQILANLLSNAVKFTERGEVTLEVRREDPEDSPSGPACRLHFVIRDTGIGIPPDRMNNLFKPFSQLDASTTRRFGGTGLGLMVSQYLSRLLGGDAWVEERSRPGSGATFHFTVRAGLTQEHPRPPYLTPNLPTLSDRRLLLWEPNAAVRTMVSYFGRLWGMQVAASDSIERVIQWAHTEAPFDVALMSIPGAYAVGDAPPPWVQVARQIHDTRPDNNIPILGLVFKRSRSLYGQPDLVTDQLTKPIFPSRLHDGIAGALSQRHPERHRRQEHRIDAGMATRLPLDILLAEDNLVNQKVSLFVLGRLGYEATLATNGRQAVEELRRRAYDVVLMDVQMPEMDGVEATRAIRADMPPDHQPYIIALTAHALTGHREEYLAAGMDDYISKPVRLEELTAALERAAGRPKRG